MTEQYSAMLANEIAAAVQSGAISAVKIVEEVLERTSRLNPLLHALTEVTAERARERAREIDARRLKGEKLGVLAGVPFSVKNLFDVRGVRTLAGSKINQDNQPAERDATLIARLESAGAILIGCANMGEYAYDFTGENAHYGSSRNPHDLQRMSGGSSGGSAAAVAAGLTPISLGSDTNGSIRVPASFCGLFGLKPTYGRLSRARTYPFVGSLDHLGPLARSAIDLAIAYDAMQGIDEDDPVQARRGIELVTPVIDVGVSHLRIAKASGYFMRGAHEVAYRAVDHVARALATADRVEIPQAILARSAAYLITMAEGSALHLSRLRRQISDFDPEVRDRLIAGSMLPASWVIKAQKFRRWFHAEMCKVFESVDIILAPSTSCCATLIGQKTMNLDGVEMAVRANIGLYTQPFSFIGLPVAAVPVWLAGESLPIGVQVIGPPWREDMVLCVARHLEREGACISLLGRV